MTRLIYLDTETTGLDPEIHDVWEIALVDHDGREHCWQIRPDLTHADPRALEIGGYYERHFTVTDAYPCPVGTCVTTHHWTTEEVGELETPETVAQQVAELLAGAVVVGSNPDFDRQFLTRWLRRHGQVWAAHYRTVDAVTLGHGYLVGCEPGYTPSAHMPPSTHDVCRAFSVVPADYDRHTALGDARMMRDLYRAITEEP